MVKQSADAKVFGVLPKRRQAGVGGEVFRDFLDYKMVGMVLPI